MSTSPRMAASQSPSTGRELSAVLLSLSLGSRATLSSSCLAPGSSRPAAGHHRALSHGAHANQNPRSVQFPVFFLAFRLWYFLFIPPFLCLFPPSSSRSCPSLPDHPPVGPSNSCFVLFSALPRKSQSRINPVHHVTLPLSSPDSLLNDSLSLSLSLSLSPAFLALDSPRD